MDLKEQPGASLGQPLPSWGCGDLCDTPALPSCHSGPELVASTDGRALHEPHSPCRESSSSSHSPTWSDHYSQKQNKIKQQAKERRPRGIARKKASFGKPLKTDDLESGSLPRSVRP